MTNAPPRERAQLLRQFHTPRFIEQSTCPGNAFLESLNTLSQGIAPRSVDHALHAYEAILLELTQIYCQIIYPLELAHIASRNRISP